jgi:hypothetical protein
MKDIVKNILIIYLLIPLIFAALCTFIWNFRSPLFGHEVSYWTVFRVLVLGVSTARVLAIGWGGK